MRSSLKKAAFWGGLAAFFGCGEEVPLGQRPLAEVDGQQITLAQLRRFEEALPKHLQSDALDAAAHREHLQSLIDRLLMRLEAEGARIDTLPSVQRKLAEITARRLSEAIVADHVTAAVEYTEDELKEAYERFDLGWQVWPAHILSDTEEEARQVIAALEEGADFLELARQRSRADDAKRGGDLGKFFGPADAIPALREGTFHLPVGTVSEPIKTKDGFEVIKILDKRRLSFEQMRPDIAKQLHQRKWGEIFAAKIDSLKARWQVRYHGEAVELVWPAKVTPEEAARPLVSYEGGAIPVAECRYLFDKIQRKGGAPPADSAGVFRHIDTHMLADTLWVKLAREEGRDTTEDYRRWYAQRREEVMLEYLYASRIATQVDVTLDEARAFYQENLESYRQLPGPIELTEVLVETRQEAEDILKRAAAGQSLKALAKRHSVRPSMEPVGGHTFGDSGQGRIEPLVVSPYREAIGDSNSRDVGRLLGPLPVQDRYSVYRLEQPVEMTLMPFRQYRKPIVAKLRQAKESEVFAGFIDSLRQAYAGKTRLYEDNLALLGAD